MNTIQQEHAPSGTATVVEPGAIKNPRGSLQQIAKQLLLAGLFWGLCMTLTAGGHRLYKAVAAADRQVSSERYQTDGKAAVWVGRRPLDESVERLSESTGLTASGQIHVLPISRFWLVCMVGFTVLAGGMAWAGQFVSNNGVQSLIGLFAGHFLWIGAVEFGLDAVGRRLGLSGALTVVNDQIVGTHGAGILIQMSAVFLIPALIGLTLHASNRCVVFQWFRKRMPLTRTVAASGRVDNYAARTTMQYFWTVWFCYAGVLWIADPLWGQLGHGLLLTTMAGILLATPYMIWRTARQTGAGQALRYSVSGAVVTWTGIEIAAAMHLFEEPWLSTTLVSGLLYLGLSIVLTGLVYSVLVKRPARFALAQPIATLFVLTLFSLSGCSGAPESEIAASPDGIMTRLQFYDERINPPQAPDADGLLHALASESPEMAAQAAVAVGKSAQVNPDVKQRLEAMAVSGDSRLTQLAALQALSRLNLLTPQSQAVIDELAADEQWAGVARWVTQ